MATQPFDTASSSIAARITAGLSRLGIAMKSRAWAESAGHRLTPTQAQILVLLRQRAAAGMRLADVARELGVRPATASEAVAALTAKGLASKGQATEDGRAVSIRLTPAGRREATAVSGWPDFMLAGIATLTVAEQTIFLRAIIKMIRVLQERGQIPVARMCVTCRFFRPHVHRSATRPHHCAFVDAPFGDAHLRIDCPDHDAAPPRDADRSWRTFIAVDRLASRPRGAAR